VCVCVCVRLCVRVCAPETYRLPCCHERSRLTGLRSRWHRLRGHVQGVEALSSSLWGTTCAQRICVENITRIPLQSITIWVAAGAIAKFPLEPIQTRIWHQRSEQFHATTPVDKNRNFDYTIFTPLCNWFAGIHQPSSCTWSATQ
jgi:hypothetical protein